MCTVTNKLIRWTAWTAAIVVLFGAGPGGIVGLAQVQQPEQDNVAAAKVNEAEYVGLTKCAACHFPQYKNWRTTAHRTAFEILPTKYRQTPACLKCHTTGQQDPSAVVGESSDDFSGVSCEGCHGPGSEHVENAMMLVREGITEERLEQLRTTIRRVALDQCVKCHVGIAHQQHPPFDPDGSSNGSSAEETAARQTTLFRFQAHDG